MAQTKEPIILLSKHSNDVNNWSQNQNQLVQNMLTNTFESDLQHQQQNVSSQTTEDSNFLQEVARGLKSYEPELIEEGEGGSYFIRNSQGQKLAVFKPVDEDPYSPRNPKLKDGRQPLEPRRGILPGEAVTREVAAYLLDHHHFAGVPLTLRVKINHPHFCGAVEGSIQRYQRHDLASWDIGPGAFEKGDVQRIALLDLRLLNTDRHGGNILVRRVECGRKKLSNNNNIYINRTVNKLVPIDHGMCLPDSTLSYEDLYFEWENWPQAKTPFEPTIRKYVEDIDLWAEVQVLRGLGIREECIRLMVVTSTLVKVTAARGFSPSAIAQLMRRVANEIDLDKIMPYLSGPAVLSSLLFHISSWVETHFPLKGDVKNLRRRGSIIARANAEAINAYPTNGRAHCPAALRSKYFHRQNSAPVILLP
eukprot:TRINITY_DN9859_c0_g1_i1.p1 TRINITY_DN9859_c0_g1~~TRINITY_DN9859_c0_g1_i1.p1  ORF type:complete len:421 (-),score=93.66 TRINITY_DN9859_c0_g1_i1:66-1328(-)